MKYCDQKDRKFSDPLHPDAAVTVFISLISVLIIALLLMILESARVEGGRLYMTIAANSSIDSLFSQYHKKLWDEYRLLGLEHYAYDQVTDEAEGFIKPYFEAANWFPMKVDSIDIEDMRLLSENDGEYFEKEVMDYMKYGIAAEVWDEITAENFIDGIKNGNSLDSLSDLYSDHTKDAVKLEDAISKIGENLSRQSALYGEAAAALGAYDGGGFISAAEEMIDTLEKLPPLVGKYISQAEAMEDGLSMSREKVENERDNLSDANYGYLEEDIEEYESYVAEDGERRVEISAFPDRADANINFLEGMISEVESIMEYIANWEPEEEGDELDEAELWAPVIAAFGGYDLISLNAKYGIEDKDTEKKLEDIKTLVKSDFLRLVLPEGAELSSETYDLTDRPSETCYMGGETDTSLIDSIYIAEYLSEVMDYFGRGVYDPGSQKTGSGHTELEYILYQKENDTDNLTESVKTLLAVRTGLNLTYLFTDDAKKAEAKAMALSITGALGLTPLVTVIRFLILTVWALGQAVCDVRDLLGGLKVPFMHTGESFYLSLAELLEFASGTVAKGPAGDRQGLKYADYLKILLFFKHGAYQDYLAMDIMQMCIRSEQYDFLMDRLIYSLNLNVSVLTGHLFSETGIVKSQGVSAGGNYGMRVSTFYSY